ncbi:acetylornithine deacetylase [Paracoccus sp. S-4012]|uniref:acetylornithine deacetylase n=1 Tax=Paracoccus sp. S-4012 TaxID=2665648 RepID=UPI0012B07663|nr:acetylornithine deacetylase [Paracoccus sp. S-4012]MRX50110.1 acetylornithine deacetylase [Paracoccus sp. S-4012]
MSFRPDFTRRLAELVAFPTVSADSNLALVEHVERLAGDFGGRCRRFPNPEGDKASLLIAVGPDAPGGIVFSGHTDVVPTTGQAWTADPWTLRDTGETLVGRGATDMKGFLACSLAVLPAIARMPLKAPVWLAFSYDEEVGCTGVGDMAEWLGANADARLAVIGEATGMELVTAHKGGCIGWAHVHGKPGHSSQPERGANAVMAAGELIAHAAGIYEGMRTTGPRMEAFNPPWSTLQVNQVEGGTHGNILAEHCRFFWEMRLIPGVSFDDVLAELRGKAAEIEARMRAVDPACSIRFDELARIPPLAPMGDAALERMLLDLLGRDTARAAPYGTEAGIFAAAGVPSVVIGPGRLADAHQPDESIAVSEMEHCTAFLTRLAETMAT